MWKQKKAQEATQFSFVAIMGLIIAITAIVITLVFVARVGTSTNSFVPAYARDVGNIMEGVTSTSADFSVVYAFKMPLKLTHADNKVILYDGNNPTPHTIFLPHDVTVIVDNDAQATKYIYLKKTGKELSIHQIGEQKQKEQDSFVRVSAIERDCGDTQTQISVTSDIAELASLNQTFAKTADTIHMKVTSDVYPLNAKGVIIYYNENVDLTTELCKLQKVIPQKLKIEPVFIPTSHESILDNTHMLLSFPSFGYTKEQFVQLFTEVEGDTNG